jgi:hypothetical protein
MTSSSIGSGRGVPGQDTHVDAIDLTLSSPEPEQRPRLPLQQQQLPTYFKEERKASRIPPHTPNSRVRPIDPQHLARIIDTSSSQAVKDVLTDLCKLSPALSGAVARGLARHSTFAQGLIRHHQPTPRAPASRSHVVKKEEGQDAHERMRKRLAARKPASGSSQSRIHSPSTFSGANGVRPTGSQSVPRVKLEQRLDVPDSDSDLDHYIPSDFPISTQKATPNKLPLRDATRPSTVNRTPSSFSLSERSARGRTEARTCTQCHEVVEGEDENGLCFYHKGPELKVNGKLICGECKKPWETSTGCAFGTHVTAMNANLDSVKRHQAKRSQSPSKKPRIF